MTIGGLSARGSSGVVSVVGGTKKGARTTSGKVAIQVATSVGKVSTSVSSRRRLLLPITLLYTFLGNRDHVAKIGGSCGSLLGKVTSRFGRLKVCARVASDKLLVRNKRALQDSKTCT